MSAGCLPPLADCEEGSQDVFSEQYQPKCGLSFPSQNSQSHIAVFSGSWNVFRSSVTTTVEFSRVLFYVFRSPVTATVEFSRVPFFFFFLNSSFLLKCLYSLGFISKLQKLDLGFHFFSF